MSDGYELLASHYDELQHTVDYPGWADFVFLLDQRYHQRTRSGDGREGRPILLDLGCGTGAFALQMEQHGYDVIGIDDSAAMLQAAREKAQDSGSSALFLQQDISRFELYGHRGPCDLPPGHLEPPDPAGGCAAMFSVCSPTTSTREPYLLPMSELGVISPRLGAIAPSSRIMKI